MKYILPFISLFLLLSFRPIDGIYDITIKTIDGNIIELSQYKGKKLLFMLLPLSTQDTTVSIQDIALLQTKYQSSLVVIGIPSEEAGYKTQDSDKLKKIYKDASADIIIAEGMKVKKGEGQSSLFQWLTNKDMNLHFDQDVEGVGSKFFVDEGGELYAVIGPNSVLTNSLMDRIVTRSNGKSNQDHTNPTGTPSSVHVKTNMEYDHAGRLKEVWKTINDDNAKKALIAENEYDELGQLKNKKLFTEGRRKDISEKSITFTAGTIHGRT